MSHGSRRRNSQRGNVLVLTCVMMPVLLGVVAFAVDLGILVLARTEAQRSADAAALAAASELIDDGTLQGPARARAADQARETADERSWTFQTQNRL